MKLRNVYIKLFILLLFILVAMQVYFLIDLNFTVDNIIHPERKQNRIIKIQMLKELMEEKIRLNNGFARAEKELQEMMLRIGRLYNAQIWVEDSGGIPVLGSFPSENKPENTVTDSKFNRTARYGNVSITHVFREDIMTKNIYTDVPLDTGTGDGLSLHILYEGKLVPFRSKFLRDLSLTILLMVILALSLLQFIRVKVNRLRKSVHRIANGDLNHRVVVEGRGVVEDLGRSFNNMTDKLEKMITSSKEITANVSHEIRGPLARIRVLEDLLRKKYHKGDFFEYERHLDNIRDDIQILDDLVGRLLEFIKLDRNETIQNYETFSPSELIDDLLIRFEPIVEFRKLQIKKESSFSSSIFSNKSTLTSAFLNIIDNAVKYTPEHGVVTIKMHRKNGFFQTSFINSFKKMGQKELDIIFNPFERLRQSDSAGSGLGLAISKKIIEKHGGNIVALNSAEGFEIRIRLPNRGGEQIRQRSGQPL